MRYSRFLALLVMVLTACARTTTAQPTVPPQPIPTLRPTAASAPPEAGASSDSGWITGDNSIELRKLQLDLGDRTAAISIVRLDPAQVRLRVGYAAEQPLSLAKWAETYQPLVVVNGGFFDQAFVSTALIISDGVASGTSYQGFGGMFTVAPNGEVDIQPLRDQPYNAEQRFTQALQSFPMLLFPDGVDSGVEWGSERDRRTAIALDQTGRLLIIASTQSSFSLNEFAEWLQTSDLAIERALNLDGGGSTGMYVAAGAAQELIEPFSRLPIVLMVEAQ